MKIIDTTFEFVPKWNGNEDLPKEEQIICKCKRLPRAIFLQMIRMQSENPGKDGIPTKEFEDILEKAFPNIIEIRNGQEIIDKKAWFEDSIFFQLFCEITTSILEKSQLPGKEIKKSDGLQDK